MTNTSNKKGFFSRLAGSISEEEDEELEIQHNNKKFNTLEEKIHSKNNIKKIENDNYNEDEDEDEDEEYYNQGLEDYDEPGELNVDVYQNSKEIIIESMIAGVKPEDLHISITRDLVTIQGKRVANNQINSDDYFYRELYWGNFSRSISLPDEIEIEGAEAVEKHGLLIIRLPKVNKNRERGIKVKSL